MAMTDRETARTNADSTIRIIKEYLQAMEDRDLAGAASFLADDFQMHFPGDQTFHTLDELVSWARPRYQWVKKAYEQFDFCPAGDENVVYCFGTLHGQWLDGSIFGDIRFIDRFVVRDGLLTNQKVWNDLAEVANR